MKTEHSRLLNGEFLLNVVYVLVTFELGGIGTLETWLKRHLHLSHDLRADNHFEISCVRDSIPIISDMTTVHDLTINVTEILVRHNIIFAKIVVEYIAANGQVTIIKRIELGPTLGTELSTAEDEGMEHNETKDESLEFEVLVFLGFIVVLLVELAHCTTQVGLEILRSLV